MKTNNFHRKSLEEIKVSINSDLIKLRGDILNFQWN